MRSQIKYYLLRTTHNYNYILNVKDMIWDGMDGAQ